MSPDIIFNLFSTKFCDSNDKIQPQSYLSMKECLASFCGAYTELILIRDTQVTREAAERNSLTPKGNPLARATDNRKDSH
ncbi:hypothetical protein EON65_47050 [archaeon]|nr:MAG: hypothetical protein EON65_47050 [archaeon]